MSVRALIVSLLALPLLASPAALDAGRCERLVSAPAPPFSVATTCDGVRPGAGATVGGIAGDSWCTLNFLFTGRGSDGRATRYIGTAGHCVLAESATDDRGGERRWAPGKGPRVLDANGDRIGEVAYAVFEDDLDFALIRLDRGVRANPRMCTFGGPTRVNDDLTETTTLLQYHGQGLLTGETVPGRTAAAQGLPHPDHVYAAGLAAPGDSGSGVVSSDGRAVGVLVTTGLHGVGVYSGGGVDAGTIGVSRLTPLVRRAEKVLRQDLTLHTAQRL
jgi:YD repeat-containing protein